jgi:hypothetical protein
MNIDEIKLNGSYVAYKENPTVLCSYGETPAQAFKQMSKLMKEQGCWHVSGVHTYFDDETHYLTVYI